MSEGIRTQLAEAMDSAMAEWDEDVFPDLGDWLGFCALTELGVSAEDWDNAHQVTIERSIVTGLHLNKHNKRGMDPGVYRLVRVKDKP